MRAWYVTGRGYVPVDDAELMAELCAQAEATRARSRAIVESARDTRRQARSIREDLAAWRAVNRPGVSPA